LIAVYPSTAYPFVPTRYKHTEDALAQKRVEVIAELQQALFDFGVQEGQPFNDRDLEAKLTISARRVVAVLSFYFSSWSP
jgi:hypothetical protein